MYARLMVMGMSLSQLGGEMLMGSVALLAEREKTLTQGGSQGEAKKKRVNSVDGKPRGRYHRRGRRVNRVEHQVGESFRWTPMVCDGPGDFWDARASLVDDGEW